MKICDICKTKEPAYATTAVIKENGCTERLELCCICYREFTYREDRARHQAYVETVKAVTGEIPRKAHWWDRFSW